MRIAVVVASLNRAEEIGQLIVALRAQTLQPSAIVLSVVSTTDLPPDLPPDVEIVMGTPGLAAQRNRGMELVLERSDAVVFFDDDFIPTKDALNGISRFFTTFPDAVGGTGLVLHDGVKEGGISYEAAIKIVRNFEAGPELPLTNEDFLFAYGCNMAFRTTAIGDLRFDENLPLYGWQEDMDFASQMSVRGKVIRTTAFAGVHRGVNKGRNPGLMLGFSQIVNPAYLVRKGTMRPKKAAALMFRNMLANHVKVFKPEPHIDRPGRLAGNWLGLFHLLRGNADPTAVLSFRN
jgi:GT2 family glycosyltransferase